MYKNIMEKLNFKMEEIRLFDSFAGIGALHQSLKELGVPVKIVGMSEIEVDAIISYAAIHINNFKDLDFTYLSEDDMRKYLIERNIGYSFEKEKSSIPRLKKDKLRLCYKASFLMNNLGDISKLNYAEIPDFDLFNMSFPCTDISNAGKQVGMTKEDGTNTRSGLYVYGIEVIKTKKPNYIMIENVKGLIQKKFINDFYGIIKEIEELGYNCYYPKKDNSQPTCLNAKDYGIPQNRERIFVICIKKDIDDVSFQFPIGKDYGIRLKDLLEDDVDEKYYINKPWHFTSEKEEKHDTNEIAQIDNVSYKALRTVCDSEKFCRCIDTMGGGQREPKVLSYNKLKQIGLLDVKAKDFCKRIYSTDNIARTIMGSGGNLDDKSGQYYIDCQVRRLTPTECWRLMGFRSDHVKRAMELGISDSSLYKQAGNSIVVNVLYYIFKNIFNKYIEE